jgi:hypothetical protein
MRLENLHVRIETMPTIESIRRTTLLLAGLCAGVLLRISLASAVACMIGAGLMMANLYALSWTVRAIFALARQAGGMSMLGVIAPPVKMLLLAGIVYLLVQSGRVSLPGFVAGTLTQFAAIFIEVGRASIRGKLSAAPS